MITPIALHNVIANRTVEDGEGGVYAYFADVDGNTMVLHSDLTGKWVGITTVFDAPVSVGTVV